MAVTEKRRTGHVVRLVLVLTLLGFVAGLALALHTILSRRNTTPSHGDTSPPHGNKPPSHAREEELEKELEKVIPPTGSPSSEIAELVAVDEALQSLPLGSVAFDVPTAMTIDEPYSVQVLLSPSQSPSELQLKLEEQLQGQLSRREAAQIKIAPRMQAIVTGQNFNISALTPDEQAVGMSQPTSWSWEVRPTQRGRQVLHLSINAVLEINLSGIRSSERRSIRTFDRNIEVQVSTRRRVTDFVGDHWQWIATVLVLPFLGWSVAKIRNKIQDRRNRKRHAGFAE